uniref:Uncharacterized protein n=1 Tax=Oryza nivara TaxID=4536 RepID=A0A0E0IAP2_ORYNI
MAPWSHAWGNEATTAWGNARDNEAPAQHTLLDAQLGVRIKGERESVLLGLTAMVEYANHFGTEEVLLKQISSAALSVLKIMPTLKRLHETYLDFYQDHTENFQQYLYLVAPLRRNHTIAAMSVRRGAKVTTAPVPVRREGRLALAARSAATAGPIAGG